MDKYDIGCGVLRFVDEGEALGVLSWHGGGYGCVDGSSATFGPI
jgi:hypothetical protein